MLGFGEAMEGSDIRPGGLVPPRGKTRLGRGGLISRMFYVYLIFSKKLNKKYIGMTDDLRKRLGEHNSGKSNFTSKGMPWELTYYEVFKNKKDALREESFLKTGKGRERLTYLFGRVA